jgi:hypothetical protein
VRRLLWAAQSAALTLRSLLSTLRRQGLSRLALLALVLAVLALLFSFLSTIPFLSPFLYPLF